MSDEKDNSTTVGIVGDFHSPKTSLGQALFNANTYHITKQDEGNIPCMDGEWVRDMSNMRDVFRWGRAKKEFISKPKTSKASKEQKRQRKARKLQRLLQKERR